MSYTETKRIVVDYIDHGYEVVNGRVQTYEIQRKKNVDINVIVDTAPYDRSVDNCGAYVENLTATIDGFKVANIAAKQANEAAIVSHATAGFMSAIEQGINLQNAGLEAETHALAGELMQQCKELAHKHDVMNKDFNRIKSRYTNLFDTINNEMSNRMRHLIQPCLDFLEGIKKEQNRRIESSLLSTATVGARESDEARIAIQVSKIKKNASSLIDTARQYIVSNQSLDKAKRFFSINTISGVSYYAPAIVFICQNEESSQNMQVFINPVFEGNGQVVQALQTYGNDLNMHVISTEESARVRQHFNNQLSELNDGTPYANKIIKLMESLYDNNAKSFIK